MRLHFGDFELDVRSYELRRGDRTVRLERQPMDLLILLVQRRGELVTRADIVDHLWGKDVFVDVETGVHTAIRKVRQALRDSPDAPAFVETVPGRGYRFIAPVEEVATAASASEPAVSASDPAAPAPSLAPPPPPPTPERPRRRWPAALSLAGVGVLAAFVMWVWRGNPGPELPVTLAVLPFANLSGDPGHDYLAEGLAEETITSLGQVDPDDLRVVARTSTLAYRQSRKSAAEIGRELGADYLVESSLRAEGGLLRVTATLIRVRDQVQVWSESFDREPSSMLGVQQELSTAIAEQIRLRLSPDRLDTLARRQTRNAEAYDLYLRGRNFENQRTPATNRKAVEYYSRATALDPDYALAWTGLAMVFASAPINGDAPPLDVRTRAREAAAQAVRSDPGLAEAQVSLGYVNWMLEWNWPEAEHRLRRALALDSRLAFAHLVLGHVLSQMGRHTEALDSTRGARELDPLNPLNHAISSQVAIQARDFPAALAHAERAVSLDSEFWIGHIMRGQANGHLGRHAQAIEALTAAGRFSGQNSKALSMRGYFLARRGRTAEAREVVKSLEEAGRTRYVPPYAIALVHAALEDWDAAIVWLERAVEVHDVHLIYLTVDPKWDPLRTDPRLEAILVRCGFRRALPAAR